MIHRGWSSSQATCEKETTDTENHTETVPMGEELHHAMPGDYYLTKAFYSVQSHRNQHVRRSVGENFVMPHDLGLKYEEKKDVLGRSS